MGNNTALPQRTPQLQCLLFQETHSRGNVLLFDSFRQEGQREAAECTGRGVDCKALGEVVFGSIPIVSEGVTTKIHFFRAHGGAAASAEDASSEGKKESRRSPGYLTVSNVATLHVQFLEDPSAVSRRRALTRSLAEEAGQRQESAARKRMSTSMYDSTARSAAQLQQQQQQQPRGRAKRTLSFGAGHSPHKKGKKTKKTFALVLSFNVGETEEEGAKWSGKQLRNWVFYCFPRLQHVLRRAIHQMLQWITRFYQTELSLKCAESAEELGPSRIASQEYAKEMIERFLQEASANKVDGDGAAHIPCNGDGQFAPLALHGVVEVEQLVRRDIVQVIQSQLLDSACRLGPPRFHPKFLYADVFVPELVALSGDGWRKQRALAVRALAAVLALFPGWLATVPTLLGPREEQRQVVLRRNVLGICCERCVVIGKKERSTRNWVRVLSYFVRGLEGDIRGEESRCPPPTLRDMNAVLVEEQLDTVLSEVMAVQPAKPASAARAAEAEAAAATTRETSENLAEKARQLLPLPYELPLDSTQSVPEDEAEMREQDAALYDFSFAFGDYSTTFVPSALLCGYSAMLPIRMELMSALKESGGHALVINVDEARVYVMSGEGEDLQDAVEVLFSPQDDEDASLDVIATLLRQVNEQWSGLELPAGAVCRFLEHQLLYLAQQAFALASFVEETRNRTSDSVHDVRKYAKQYLDIDNQSSLNLLLAIATRFAWKTYEFPTSTTPLLSRLNSMLKHQMSML